MKEEINPVQFMEKFLEKWFPGLGKLPRSKFPILIKKEGEEEVRASFPLIFGKKVTDELLDLSRGILVFKVELQLLTKRAIERRLNYPSDTETDRKWYLMGLVYPEIPYPYDTCFLAFYRLWTSISGFCLYKINFLLPTMPLPPDQEKCIPEYIEKDLGGMAGFSIIFPRKIDLNAEDLNFCLEWWEQVLMKEIRMLAKQMVNCIITSKCIGLNCSSCLKLLKKKIKKVIQIQKKKIEVGGYDIELLKDERLKYFLKYLQKVSVPGVVLLKGTES